MTPFSFDRIIIFGASILNSLSGYDAERYLLQEYGITKVFQNSSAGGRTSAAGAAAIDAVVAAIPVGQIAVFVVHLGGNNLPNIMNPANTANRAQYLADMGYIYDAITSAGHTCIVTPISFRDYTAEYGGNSYDDPYAFGSERINVDLLMPFQATKFPDQIGANGRPYFDMHNRFYNDGPIILDPVDGQHLRYTIGIARYLLDTVMQLSTTGVAPAITRFADPRTHQRKPASINVNLFSPTAHRCEVKGLNNVYETNSTLALLDANNEETGMILSHPAYAGAITGIGDSVTFGLDYLTPRQTQTYLFANGGETNTYTITGAPLSTDATIRIASSRNTSDVRNSVFSINGAGIGSVNSGSTTIVPTLTSSFVTGAGGAMNLSHTGTTFSYLNSFEVDFTYPAPPLSGTAKSNTISIGIGISL